MGFILYPLYNDILIVLIRIYVLFNFAIDNYSFVQALLSNPFFLPLSLSLSLSLFLSISETKTSQTPIIAI